MEHFRGRTAKGDFAKTAATLPRNTNEDFILATLPRHLEMISSDCEKKMNVEKDKRCSMIY